MFVCLGNICRSPAAEGVYKHYLERQSIPEIQVESSGTSAYHCGEKADPRMRHAADSRGIQLTSISQHFSDQDLDDYDLVLAMDRANQKDIQAQAKEANKHKIKLFSDFKTKLDYIDVPDPYYGGESGFDNVLDIIEDALPNLTEYLNEL